MWVVDTSLYWVGNILPFTQDGKEFLVPVCHLLNHNPGDGDEGAFAITACDAENLQYFSYKEGKKDMECFFAYGIFPNEDLLFRYGFALQNNPDDIVDITLHLEVRTPYTDYLICAILFIITEMR